MILGLWHVTCVCDFQSQHVVCSAALNMCRQNPDTQNLCSKELLALLDTSVMANLGLDAGTVDTLKSRM